MEPNWRLASKKDNLMKRARILQQIRAFFIDQNFLEVETPQRIPANAPELYIDAVACGDWFLQTSPELCMKRLLAADYEQIFQISHCWREGERGQRHLPEYTMLEWYRARSDYNTLMDDCQALLTSLCPEHRLHYQGREIDLTPPWPRLTLEQAFAHFASIDIDEAIQSNTYDMILSEEIEPSLPQNRPTFLIDYPLEHASLARRKDDDSRVAERVELYIGGLELANGFSELNDSAEQKQRFDAEETLRREHQKAPYPSAHNFLNELNNMPEAAGIALGIDRLTMLLCNEKQIDRVVAFSPEDL